MQILAFAPRRRETAAAKNRPGSPISGCEGLIFESKIPIRALK